MSTCENQVEYWDSGAAADKVFSHPLNVDRIRRLAPLDGPILDYGCGYGRLASLLLDAGYRDIVGVDLAPTMVARAQQAHPTLTFLQADSTRLPFSDGHFAAILLFAVLTCIPDDAGQLAIVGEARRLLSKGGLLYISDLWLQHDARNVDRYQQFAEKHGRYGVFELPEGVILRHHDPKWIKELTSGFDQVAFDEITVTTMNGHTARGFQWFGQKFPT